MPQPSTSRGTLISPSWSEQRKEPSLLCGCPKITCQPPRILSLRVLVDADEIGVAVVVDAAGRAPSKPMEWDVERECAQESLEVIGVARDDGCVDRPRDDYD